LGELGLQPDYFWSLTWREYYFICEGYFEREEIKWEHTRSIVALIYNSNTKKGSQKKAEDLIPLRRDLKRKEARLKKAKETKAYINGKT
jgi:hypothetical protein